MKDKDQESPPGTRREPVPKSFFDAFFNLGPDFLLDLFNVNEPNGLRVGLGHLFAGQPGRQIHQKEKNA